MPSTQLPQCVSPRTPLYYLSFEKFWKKFVFPLPTLPGADLGFLKGAGVVVTVVHEMLGHTHLRLTTPIIDHVHPTVDIQPVQGVLSLFEY